MDFVNFRQFAKMNQSSDCFKCRVVNGCMDAMEEGRLPVIASNDLGFCLWERYILTVDEWARMCALLQRNRLPPSLL